jgi:hypothetical protein
MPLAPMDTDGDVKMASVECEEKAPGLEGLARNTVVIFDYDDTLLASSFLAGKGFRLDADAPEKSSEIDTGLRELEQSVISVLTQALKLGHVHIVTNAETGWVQLSAQKFLPAIVPILQKVRVISARSTFEGLHPDSPLKWKFCAFQEALTSVYGGLETKVAKNVISFGDRTWNGRPSALSPAVCPTSRQSPSSLPSAPLSSSCAARSSWSPIASPTSPSTMATSTFS